MCLLIYSTVASCSVRALLYNTEQKAILAGAERDDRHDVIYLVEPSGYPKDRPTSPASIEDWTVRRASAARDEELFVRTVADENCVEHRPVPVRLEWYTNPVVFPQGKVVATRRVHGNDAEEDIFSDLIGLLQHDVRNAALASPYEMVPSEEGLGSAYRTPA